MARKRHSSEQIVNELRQAEVELGKPLGMPMVIGEHTRECLTIDVARTLKSDDVLERLAWLMATRGVHEHIRSDNGPEFTANAVRARLAKVSNSHDPAALETPAI